MRLEIIALMTILSLKFVRCDLRCSSADWNAKICSDTEYRHEQKLIHVCKLATYLTIELNTTTSIDKSVFTNCNPMELTLINGALQDIAPNSFRGYTRLEKLNLSGNRIQRILKKTFSFDMNYEYNQYNQNKPKYVIAEYGSLYYLDYQHYQYNPYKYINNLPDLIIDLNSNQIDIIEDGAFYNPNTFKKLSVNLSHNQLLDVSVPSITVADFNDLNLSFNKIERIRGIGSQFFKASLEFGHNQLKTVDFSVFNNSQIYHLGLSYNNLTNLICNGKINTTINKLNVSHNKLINFNVNCLGQSNQLSYVDLSFNNITKIVPSDNKPSVINRFIINNNSITVWNTSIFSKIDGLDLRFNHIKNFVCGSVSEFEMNWLNVSHNEISKFNLSCLGQDNQIDFVDLSFNNITEIIAGENGPFSINRVIINNNPIIFFNMSHFGKINLMDLRYNQIQDIICDLISEVEINWLDVSHNAISQFNLSCLGQANHMDYLELSFNNITKITSTKNGSVSINRVIINKNPILYFNTSPFGKIGSMDLRFNQIQYFACDSINEVEINWLDASHNKMVKFNLSCLGHDKLIDFVNVSYNQIEDVVSGNQRPKEIRTLHLNHNKMKYLNTTYLANIQVHFLNASFNEITEIYGNSTDDIKIKQMDLSNNQIKLFNFSYLGTSLMTFLDLSFNELSEIVINPVRQPTVDKLDLSHNSLKTLPEFALPDVKVSLDLSYNKIESIHTKTFFNLHNLTDLNLSNNRLINLQFGVFHNLDNLDTLDLSNNRLISKDLHTIYELNRLNTFYFHNNQIEYFEFKNFPGNLKTISFYGNNLNFTCLEFYKLLTVNSRFNIIEGQQFDKDHVRGIACKHSPNEEKSLKKNITDQDFLIQKESLSDLQTVQILKNLTNSIDNLSKSTVNNNDRFLDEQSTLLKKLINIIEEHKKINEKNLPLEEDALRRNNNKEQQNPNGSLSEKLIESINSNSNQFTLFIIIILLACLIFIILKNINFKRFFSKKRSNPNQNQDGQSTRGSITPEAQELTEI